MGEMCLVVLTCINSGLFFVLQKCERLLLYLFCSELNSVFQKSASLLVSLKVRLTIVEKLTGLLSDGVTVTVILIVCNTPYLSVMTEIRNQRQSSFTVNKP